MSINLNDASVAYIQAQVALMNCRVAGMIAENQHRMLTGQSIAYRSDEFTAVEREFEPMLCHNAILTLAQS